MERLGGSAPSATRKPQTSRTATPLSPNPPQPRVLQGDDQVQRSGDGHGSSEPGEKSLADTAAPFVHLCVGPFVHTWELQIIDLVKDASAKDIRAGGVVVKTEPAGFSDSSGDTPYNNAMLTHGAACTANNNKRMASPTANHSNKRMAPSPTGLSAVKRAPPKNPYGK